MKKGTILLLIFAFCVGFFGLIALKSLIISNPKAESCITQTLIITEISEGSSNDIVFSDSQGDQYYINRGLERGLNLDTLNAKVLNKTVTLHLPNSWLGTSKHVAQLAIGNDIIFTEFPSVAEAVED